MEEKLRLLEMEVHALKSAVNKLEDTVKKMDQALDMLFQIVAATKAIYDQVQFNKPAEIPIKPEIVK